MTSVNRALMLTIVLLVATWVVAYSAIERERTRVTLEAITDAERVAQMFENRTKTIVGYTDNYIRSVRREYLRTSDTNAVQDVINDIPLDQEIISHITIIDAAGTPIYNSRFPIRPNSTAKDRGYFLNFKDSPEDDVFFSESVRGRNSGLALMRLVRPLSTADGTFAGVIFAAIRVETFVDFLSAMRLGRGSSASLIGTDMRIRARGPTFPEGNAQNAEGSGIWAALANAPAGTIEQQSPIDGVTRIQAYRTLDPLPFVISVGIAQDAVSDRYQTYQWATFGIATLVSFLLIFAMFFYRRELLAVQTLADSYDRFQSYANSAADWLWEMDKDLRFSYVSENVEEICGVSAEWHIGKSRSDVVGADVSKKLWQDHIQTLEAREPFRDFIYERIGPNGTGQWLRVSGLPIFDHIGNFKGYRGTGSNISEQIAAEARLQSAYEALEETIAQRTRELRDEVAERKKAEADLRKTHEQLRDFGAAASDWYWEMDAELRFSYFSDRFQEVTGVDTAMLMGKTRQETGIPNVDPIQWSQHLSDLENRRPFRNFMHPRKREDGKTVWLSINGKPIFNGDGSFGGYRGTGSDITEWRGAQQRVLALSAAIESMPEPVAVFDEEDKFSFTNFAYRELNAAIVEKVQIGEPFEDYIQALVDKKMVPSAVGREDEWRTMRMLYHQKPSSYFEDRRQGDTWYLCVDNALPHGGRVLLLTDITNLKTALFDLEKAKAQAEAASQAKSDFLSSMSHELRTPMNAILGFSQMLSMQSETNLSESEQKYIEHIVASGEHLLGLITNVLELSKIEAGFLEVEITAVDPNSIIHQCVMMSRAMADDLNITLIDQTESTPLPLVEADPMRLQQILLNLLSNAIKYNVAGGTVSISGYLIQGDLIRIVVQDTGVGIPEAFFDKVFEPFDRHVADIGQTAGAGIGLTITKQLVSLLNGQIGFESEQGVGSTFWVDLPSSKDQPKDKASYEASITIEEEPPMIDDELDGVRVLYVEDNMINVQLMETIFDDIPGSILDVARDGESGLEIAKTTKPDIILMDIGLPGMDGIETTSALKANPVTASIPVIAISAAAMKSDIERASAAGFFAYLTKPIDILETLSKIKEALEKTKPVRP